MKHDTTTSTTLEANDVPSTPPAWYPLPTWAPEGDFYYVAPADRAEYAAIPLEDDNLRSWLEPQRAAIASPVVDNLPAGLHFEDVAEGLGPDGEPAQLGYITSTGGMAAVRARQHEYALGTVRADRRSAALTAAQMRARLRTCPVCRGTFDVVDTLPVRLPTGAEVAACGPCAPVAASAIVAALGATFLPDGRTRSDAALSWAVGMLTH